MSGPVFTTLRPAPRGRISLHPLRGTLNHRSAGPPERLILWVWEFSDEPLTLAPLGETHSRLIKLVIPVPGWPGIITYGVRKYETGPRVLK